MWCSAPSFIVTLLGWIVIMPPIAFALGWWTRKRIEGEFRRSIQIDDERCLQVVVTSEGVILDAFIGDHHIGTEAMTFDEWWEDIRVRDRDRTLSDLAARGGAPCAPEDISA